MSSLTKPLPCPFCGSDEIKVFKYGSGSDAHSMHQCQHCGACGPDDCEGLNWNTRSVRPPAATEGSAT